MEATTVRISWGFSCYNIAWIYLWEIVLASEDKQDENDITVFVTVLQVCNIICRNKLPCRAVGGWCGGWWVGGIYFWCWQTDRHLNRCACRYNRVNTTFYICRYLNVKEPENYAFLCYNAFFGFTSLFLFWYHKLEVVWHSLIGFLVQCETLRMYLCWSLCTLYWHAYQVRVTVGDSCLRFCVCVTSFERWLTPLCFFSFSSPVQVMGKESRDRAAEGNPGYTFHCTFTIVSF